MGNSRSIRFIFKLGTFGGSVSGESSVSGVSSVSGCVCVCVRVCVCLMPLYALVIYIWLSLFEILANTSNLIELQIFFSSKALQS